MIDFFQSVGIKQYIFIDCENGDISNADKTFNFLNEKNCFSLDTQIFCMIGAELGQNKWYDNFLKKVNALHISCNITPVRISTVGENALDNVLSAYIGLVLSHSPNAEYTIIAFDKGYDAVVEHFKSANIKIQREILSETDKDTEEKVDAIFRHFVELKTSKPTTLKTLRASISRFAKKNGYDEKLKDKLKSLTIKRLKSEGKIQISQDNTVLWK